MMMDRRRFLSNAGAAALLLSAAPSLARSRARHFGVQLFSIPKMLEQDFAKAIGFLAKLGYREVEIYGPYTFSDPTQIAHWKRITPELGFSGSGFFGKTLAEARTILKANGISVPSMHTDLLTLQGRMGPLAEAAHQLGATYVTLPSIPADHRQTLDDYRRTADIFNQVGADAIKHGVKFAYHNHGYGLKPVDGQVPLELLLKATDPTKVFLELDLYWTVAGGADPIDLLRRHSGRYKMIHLKDMKEIHHFEGDGGTPDQWIKMFPYMTYLGDGAIDLPAVLAMAETSGVEHYFVEQDTVADPETALRNSAGYLLKQGFK
ncbi:sugar phosphate isomerase/epimerase family protein [Sphingomonas sp. YL-JM2C]